MKGEKTEYFKGEDRIILKPSVCVRVVCWRTYCFLMISYNDLRSNCYSLRFNFIRLQRDKKSKNIKNGKAVES